MYGHSPLLPFCCSPPYTSYGKKIESPALSEHIRRIVTSYAMWFNNKYGRYDHLFQDRFKSEVIEDENYLLRCFRYILYNPVRTMLKTRQDKITSDRETAESDKAEAPALKKD